MTDLRILGQLLQWCRSQICARLGCWNLLSSGESGADAGLSCVQELGGVMRLQNFWLTSQPPLQWPFLLLLVSRLKRQVVAWL